MNVTDIDLGTGAVARAVRYWNDEEPFSPYGHAQLPELVLGPFQHGPGIRVRIATPTLPNAVAECQRHANGSATVRVLDGWQAHWLVVAHELGHALGLEHDDDHPVMATTYHQLRRRA